MSFFHSLLSTAGGAPTTQATNLVFSNITATSMTISWTNGNGTKRLVLMKANSGVVEPFPSNGQPYTANTVFGSGSQVGSGNYVVFNGTGNSVTVTGLTASSFYGVRVVEYIGDASPIYNTSPATNNPLAQATVYSDYQGVLTAATSAGDTLPTTAQQVITNLYIAAKKFNNAFPRALAKYSFIQTGDAGFVKFNLKDPGNFKLVNTGTITKTTDGTAGNGTSSFYNTVFTPSVNGAGLQRYFSVIVHVFTSSQQNTLIAGVTDTGGTHRISIATRNTSDQCTIRINGATAATISGITDGSGVWQFNMFSDLLWVYRNGVCLYRAAFTTSGLPNQSIYIHAQHNSVGGADTFSSKVVSAIEFATRMMVPEYTYADALKNDNSNFFRSFLANVNVKKNYTLTSVTSSTGLDFDGGAILQRVDGKYDILGGDNSGNLYYYEQGANISTWTRTTLATTGHDIECVAVWGRVASRLVIITLHSEDATQHVRLHYADTTNDKGTYTTVVISNNTLPFAKSLFLYDIDNDGQLELLIAWQGNSIADGGLSWIDYTGGTITTPANWVLRTPTLSGIPTGHLANLWNIYGFLSNGKLLVSGRNYPERFLGGDGPGVHLITIPANPVSGTWVCETIYNPVNTEPGFNRILDYLHAIPILVNGVQRYVMVINYDTGTLTFIDLLNSYSAQVINTGLTMSMTRAFATSTIRNGRSTFICICEDSAAYEFSWDGTSWTYEKLFTTLRHPADGQMYEADIDNDGANEIVFFSGQLTYAGAADGQIGILKA